MEGKWVWGRADCMFTVGRVRGPGEKAKWGCWVGSGV